MVHKGLFIFVAFTAIAFASEIEDAEQKKRGAGKANALNAIPSGAQKPDYSYNIYPQNSSPQSGPSQHYQTSVSNFYPLQSSSQYYTSSNTADVSTSHSPQPSHGGQSHFVPINFVPNPGYQTKYQIVSPKAGSNVLTVIPSPAIQPAHMLQYTNPFYASNSNNHVASGSLLGSLSHGPFSFGPSFHPLSLSGSFIGQPSAMVMLSQPHSPIYNNLIYPSTASNLYNYYPSNSQAQAKYYSPGPVQSIPAQANEYEKVQTSQSISKEENGGLQNADYISPSNVNSGYNSHNSYSKI